MSILVSEAQKSKQTQKFPPLKGKFPYPFRPYSVAIPPPFRSCHISLLANVYSTKSYFRGKTAQNAPIGSIFL